VGEVGKFVTIGRLVCVCVCVCGVCVWVCVVCAAAVSTPGPLMTVLRDEKSEKSLADSR